MKFFFYINLLAVFMATTAHANGWYSGFTIDELQYSAGADGVQIKFMVEQVLVIPIPAM